MGLCSTGGSWGAAVSMVEIFYDSLFAVENCVPSGCILNFLRVTSDLFVMGYVILYIIWHIKKLKVTQEWVQFYRHSVADTICNLQPINHSLNELEGESIS